MLTKSILPESILPESILPESNPLLGYLIRYLEESKADTASRMVGAQIGMLIRTIQHHKAEPSDHRGIDRPGRLSDTKITNQQFVKILEFNLENGLFNEICEHLYG